MQTSFEVKTEGFQGPLNKLLEMIEERKLFISDISLARVAGQYIEYVREAEVFPLGDATEFINVASTLLLIKSKSLLPNLELTEEEEEGIEDLEDRLRELKRIKDLSKNIGKIFGRRIIFCAQERPQSSRFSPDQTITEEGILLAAKSVINSLPKFSAEEKPRTRVEKVISLDEMIENLTGRVKEAARMRFSEFSKKQQIGNNKEKRINVVISFLAILELFKQGVVEISQEKEFAEIEIESKEISVPRY